jgi:hypothetical protein
MMRVGSREGGSDAGVIEAEQEREFRRESGVRERRDGMGGTRWRLGGREWSKVRTDRDRDRQTNRKNVRAGGSREREQVKGRERESGEGLWGESRRKAEREIERGR